MAAYNSLSPSPLFLFFFSLFFSFRIFRTISNLKEREACSKSTCQHIVDLRLLKIVSCFLITVWNCDDSRFSKLIHDCFKKLTICHHCEKNPDVKK